jgi:hypothetical protein
MSEIIDRDLFHVRQNIQIAERFTSSWHNNILNWRALYNGNHYGDNPKAKSTEQRYNDPTHGNTVDLATAILRSNEMIWHSQGFNPSKNEENRSSILEKFIAGAIDINTDRHEYDLQYEIVLRFVRDGGGVLLGVWDDQLHDNFEPYRITNPDGTEGSISGKLFKDLPLRIECIDPLKVFMYPGGSRRWQCVYRKENMSSYDVEHTYGIELEDYKDKTDIQKLEIKGDFVDYWEYAWKDEVPDTEVIVTLTPETMPEKLGKKLIVQHAMLFEDKFVLPLEEADGYKEIPYTISFYKPTDIEDSSCWHSILSPLEEPVREMEEVVNMRKRNLLIYSSLPFLARTKGGRPIVLDKSLGKAIPLAEGEDLGFPEWRGSPPDFDRQIELYRARIQQSGFSDIMFGSGGDSSGYGMSQLSDQNRLRLETPLIHLEALWTWAARKWLDLVQEFAPDGSFQIYGQMRGKDFAELVRAEDLTGLNIRCEIKPDFPNERTRNHALAVQVKGTLSDETIMEKYLGIGQPDEEHEKLLRELAERHPLMIQEGIMAKLKEAADVGDEVAATVLEMLKQQLEGNKGQNPDGRPPEPSNIPQLTGTQTPTGGVTPTNNPADTGNVLNGMRNQANAAPDMSGNIGGQP